MNNRENNILERKVFMKAVMALAIPVALQNLLTTSGSMIDTMMIGSIGVTSVGAVGLCAQFSSLMLSCYWGLLGGGILFIGQNWGAKDEDGITRSYGMMMTTMMLVGFVFGALALFFPQFVMSVYTDKEVYQEIGIEYLKIVGFAYPLQVFSVSASGLLRSTERVKIPLVASIVSVLSNLFFNWVFIFGHLGAPAMGVRGAALATVIAAILNVSVTLVLSKIVGYSYIFQVSRHFRWSRSSVKEFLIKCFPIICNEIAMGASNLIINVVLGRQATEAIAGLAVFRTFEGMVIAFFAGFSSASSVLVGKRVGAGELDDAFVIANRLVYLCAGTIFLVCCVLFGISTPLLHAMGLSGASFEYGKGLLLIYCIIAMLRMSNWISNDTCRASGDAVTGTVLEITFMYLLNIPLICIGGLVLHLPFFLVFMFAYIDEPIRVILMQIHMHSGGWIRPVTEPGKNALVEFRKKHPLRFFWTKMGLS